MHIFVFILLAILLLPVLLLWLIFEGATTGLELLGLSPQFALGILFVMLLGSLFHIPLSRKKLVSVEERHFFGLFRRERVRLEGITLNVGGGLIPVSLALYLLFTKVPLGETLLATLFMTAISYHMARIIPGRGIALPVFIPPLFAALFAFLLAPEHASAVAFASGTLGVLVGADIFHIPDAMKKAGGVLSIGGAGVFDGIFLVGIVSALLAAL